MWQEGAVQNHGRKMHSRRMNGQTADEVTAAITGQNSTAQGGKRSEDRSGSFCVKQQGHISPNWLLPLVSS
jgi:hypothetical protein